MKKIISLILSFIMLVSAIPFAVSASKSVEKRDTTFEEELAVTLRDLGLFKGVSETNFALDRAPTRIEALVMLIRVLGKETEALDSDYTHPFVDVPSWADKYVGYAYETKLTNGVSADKFGSGDASAAMYLTFVLRSLGYSDTNGADFTWNDPYSLAEEIKILPENVDREKFWRADVATVSYAALKAKLKDSDETLAEKLISVGAIDEEQFDEVYDADKLAPFFVEEKEDEQDRQDEQDDVISVDELPEENKQQEDENRELPVQTSGKYVLNTNTKRIHSSDCSSVKKIKPEHIGYTDYPETFLDAGYVWCGNCYGK